MASYKFESPDKTGSPFDPTSLMNGFLRIPEKPGVYIWGYLVAINGKTKFCPVNVGETNDLRKRLYSDHYVGNMPAQQKNRKGEKEVFAFSSQMTAEQVGLTYDAMAKYNDRNPCSNKARCQCFFCAQKEHQDKLLFYQGFQDLNKVQEHKLPETSQNNIRLYDLFTLLHTQMPSHSLVHRIDEFHSMHTKNFYCIFLQDNSKKPFLAISPDNRRSIESQVKKILSTELGIVTTAKGGKNVTIDIKIDLTCIKDKLIALTKGRENKKYVNRENNYHKIDNLILPKS